MSSEKNNLFDKRGDDYVHDTIIERIGSLEVDCPECENIIPSDEQYQCGTCGGGSMINVLSWIRSKLPNNLKCEHNFVSSVAYKGAQVCTKCSIYK